MQYCSVLVALGGETQNVVLRENVSVPEILVLMSLHGKESVTREPDTTTESSVVHGGLLEMLKTSYGNDVVGKLFGTTFGATLPTRLAEIGLSSPEDVVADTEADAPVAKKASK